MLGDIAPCLRVMWEAMVRVFTEGSLSNDIRSNFNRAKMAWYNIDPSFFDNGVSPSEVLITKRLFAATLFVPFEEEICPACDLTGQVNTQVSTLDLAFILRNEVCTTLNQVRDLRCLSLVG